MSGVFKQIAKNTRYYRLKKGLTQAQLAERAKLSREYISLVENAKIDIYLTKLIRLAKALGVEAGDLTKFD